jgi:hypothetical protein
MEYFRSAGGAGSVIRLAGAATVPIAPHAPGFQARYVYLPLLLRGVSPVVHATASHTVAEVRTPAAMGKAAAHG